MQTHRNSPASSHLVHSAPAPCCGRPHPVDGIKGRLRDGEGRVTAGNYLGQPQLWHQKVFGLIFFHRLFSFLDTPDGTRPTAPCPKINLKIQVDIQKGKKVRPASVPHPGGFVASLSAPAALTEDGRLGGSRLWRLKFRDMVQACLDP